MAKGTGLPTNSILVAPDYVQGVVLATGSSNAQAFDVPAGMAYVGFSMNGDFWVSYGSTAATIPGTSTTAGTTTPELNPTFRNLRSTQATTGIAISAEQVTKGSMSWYKAA